MTSAFNFNLQLQSLVSIFGFNFVASPFDSECSDALLTWQLIHDRKLLRIKARIPLETGQLGGNVFCLGKKSLLEKTRVPLELY